MAEDLTADKDLHGAEDADAVLVRKRREEAAPESLDQPRRFRQGRELRAQFGEEHQEEDQSCELGRRGSRVSRF